MRPRYADLLATLRDPDSARADRAYDAILFDRGEAVVDLAEAYAQHPGDPFLRFYIIQLMGFSEDPRAIPTVVDALNDPEPAVRAEACRALEDLRAKDEIDPLRGRIQDVDPSVRQAAVEALGALGAPI